MAGDYDDVMPRTAWYIVFVAGSLMAFLAVSFGPKPKPVEQVQSVTECIDGVVQQGRPGDWKPVYTRKSKRTIPCEV